MKGMILAAGLGTRLGPLTLERAKAAIPAAGRAAAAWAALALARAGVTDVAVNLHHLPGSVTAALGDGSALGVRILYSHEPAILGTGGGIRQAIEILGPGPLLVVNGDVVTDLDLGLLIEHHRRSGAAVTLALVPRPDHARFGTVTIGAGRITSIAGRRGSSTPAEVPAVFAGIHVMEPEAQALLPSAGCVVRETFFAMLDRAIPIAGYMHRGYWSDIGTPAEYLQNTIDILRGRAGGLAPPRPLEGGSLIGDNVRVDGSARIGPDVVLGDGAVVEPGSDLEACIVWDGARASGTLRRAVVCPGRTVTVEGDGP